MKLTYKTGNLFTGQGTKSFLGNLSLVSLGFGAGKMIASLVTLSAGRLLGPHEFGLVNLAVSVGTLLYMTMLLGLNSSIVKYCAGTNEFDERQRVFSTSVHMEFFMILAIAAVSLTLKRFLSGLFGISADVYNLGIGFAVSISLYAITVAMCEATGKFRLRSIIELVFGVVLALTFFGVCFFNGEKTHLSLCLGYICAYIGSFAVAIVFLRPYYRLYFDVSLAKKLINYGIYMAVCGLAFFVIVNLQRIYINRLLSPRDVGIFSGYALGSVNVGMLAATVFVTVFFPKASASHNHGYIFHKLSRASSISFVPGLLAFVLAIKIVCALLGPQYQFKILTALFFALGSIMIWLVSVFGYLVAACGDTRGMRSLVFANICGALFSAIASPYAIRLWGGNGAIVVFDMAYVISFVIIFKFLNSLFI